MTVYRDKRDDYRIVVHQRPPRPGFLRGEWDVDVWSSWNVVTSFTSGAGDAFATKAEAKAWAEKMHGKLTSLLATTHPEVTSHWRKGKR